MGIISTGRCFTYITYEYLIITDDRFSGISTVRPEVISSRPVFLTLSPVSESVTVYVFSGSRPERKNVCEVLSEFFLRKT